MCQNSFDYSRTYYKVLNKNLRHHGFSYKIGLNVDIEEFNKEPICDVGGLYFTDADNICGQFHNGVYLAQIHLCPDSKIVRIEDACGDVKYKTNKLMILNIMPIKEHPFVTSGEAFRHGLKYLIYGYPEVHEILKPYYTLDTWLLLAQNTKVSMREVPHEFLTREFYDQVFTSFKRIDFYSDSEDYVLRAIKNMPLAFRNFKYQTQKTADLAVSLVSENIEYVDDQFKTEEMCKSVILDRDDPLLKYIKQTPIVVAFLLEFYGISCFKYLNDEYKTEQICKKAVNCNPAYIQYVPQNLQTEELVDYAVDNLQEKFHEFIPKIFDNTKLNERQLLKLTKHNANLAINSLKHLKFPSVCLQLVNQNGLNLKYIPKEFQTEEICAAAVKQNPHVKKYACII